MDQIIIRTATLADLDILFSFEQGIIFTHCWAVRGEVLHGRHLKPKKNW